MTCPNCGYIFAPFEQSCPKCARLACTTHAQVRALSAPTQNSGSLPHKICPTCGQPAVLEMAACGRCGRPFATYPNRRDPRVVLGVIAGVLLVCFLGSLVFLSGRTRPAGPFSRIEGLRPGGAPDLTSAMSHEVDSRLLRASATMGGDLEVSLVWNTLSDMDLEMRDPTGELVDAYNPRSRSGGIQDVDANPTLLDSTGSARVMMGQPPGAETMLPIPEILIDPDKRFGFPAGTTFPDIPGMGGKAPSKFTRTPIEHIYFKQAPRGTYSVFARCYSWREPNRNPLPILIQVRSHGKVIQEVNAALGPTSYVADGISPTQIIQFTLP